MIDPQLALTALEVQDNPLSPREVEVLRRAAVGAGPAEIAADRGWAQITRVFLGHDGPRLGAPLAAGYVLTAGPA